jgi:hypothetical protein
MWPSKFDAPLLTLILLGTLVLLLLAGWHALHPILEAADTALAGI